jgi:hypothetical protein
MTRRHIAYKLLIIGGMVAPVEKAPTTPDAASNVID